MLFLQQVMHGFGGFAWCLDCYAINLAVSFRLSATRQTVIIADSSAFLGDGCTNAAYTRGGAMVYFIYG